jgi:hypothetical protein
VFAFVETVLKDIRENISFRAFSEHTTRLAMIKLSTTIKQCMANVSAGMVDRNCYRATIELNETVASVYARMEENRSINDALMYLYYMIDVCKTASRSTWPVEKPWLAPTIVSKFNAFVKEIATWTVSALAQCRSRRFSLGCETKSAEYRMQAIRLHLAHSTVGQVKPSEWPESPDTAIHWADVFHKLTLKGGQDLVVEIVLRQLMSGSEEKVRKWWMSLMK